MTFVYLASPYTAEKSSVMEGRYVKARWAAYHLTLKGLVVYSPIVHFHDMAVIYEMPRSAEFWEKQNFTMLKAAGLIVVLKIDGWENSVGIAKEIQHAQTLGKPVRYVSHETFELED